MRYRDYLIKRLLTMILVLWLVSGFVFVLVRLLPGDIVDLISQGAATKEQLAQLRGELGLDKSLPEQYVIWLGNILHGDLGTSLLSRHPVVNDILQAMPVSLELAVLAVGISATIALLVGTVSAVRQDTLLDYGLRLLSVAALSAPTFWTATIFLLIGSLYFHWIPPIKYIHLVNDPLGNLKQFIFPALIQGYFMGAVVMRITRSQVLEVLRQDYVRTAEAKGLREWVVLRRHVLRNALIPIITLFGIQLLIALGGLVIIEQIFALPGVGRLMLTAIVQRDYTVIQGVVLFIATATVLINLLVDLMYAYLDPRIRYA